MLLWVDWIIYILHAASHRARLCLFLISKPHTLPYISATRTLTLKPERNTGRARLLMVDDLPFRVCADSRPAPAGAVIEITRSSSRLGGTRFTHSSPCLTSIHFTIPRPAPSSPHHPNHLAPLCDGITTRYFHLSHSLWSSACLFCSCRCFHTGRRRLSFFASCESEATEDACSEPWRSAWPTSRRT